MQFYFHSRAYVIVIWCVLQIWLLFTQLQARISLITRRSNYEVLYWYFYSQQDWAKGEIFQENLHLEAVNKPQCPKIIPPYQSNIVSGQPLTMKNDYVLYLYFKAWPVFKSGLHLGIYDMCTGLLKSLLGNW